MQLITPDIGLIVWAIIAFMCFPVMLIALISILRNDFKDSTTKLIWVLVVLFMPIIGSILYFAIGRKQIIR